MNPQKNQGNQPQGLLDGIQSEVSAENAPLLEFITKYASYIAGGCLAILLILGGMGVWKWYHGGKQREAQEELARINLQLKGAEHDDALGKLAQNAPDSVKLSVYLSLGQSALENGNPVLAAEAYAKAADLDKDGALGTIAALGGAGSLLMQAKYTQALALLQELEARAPQITNSIQFQQMLAEAANKAGDYGVAQKTYQRLAEEVHTPEDAYYRDRADALARQIANAGDNQHE